MELQDFEPRKYLKTGFATPSGKVELSSSILDELGFDPLPYYREGPALTEEFPYAVFSGVREDPFFQTGQRNIPNFVTDAPCQVSIFILMTLKKRGLSMGTGLNSKRHMERSLRNCLCKKA